MSTISEKNQENPHSSSGEDNNINEFTPRTDLSESTRSELVEDLTTVLANSFMLMVKTQGVHWNIVGPLFGSVHEMTEQQYKNIFDAIDELAERIRALGGRTPASYKHYGTISSLKHVDEPATADEQLRWLIADHEATARHLRPLVGKAEEMNDWASHDLLTERLAFHEQAIWMLRATNS